MSSEVQLTSTLWMSQLCMYIGKFQALSFISLTETRQKAEPQSATHILPKDQMEADRDLASGYALHPSSASGT